MNGRDIAIARHVEVFEIRQALARIVGAETPVVLVRSLLELADIEPGDASVCVVRPIPGEEFRTLLELHCGKATVWGELTDEEFAFQLAIALGCDLLVPDDSADPFVSWLVTPAREQTLVELDSEAMEHQDDFRVIGPWPSAGGTA